MLRPPQRPEVAELSVAGYSSTRVLRSSGGVQVHELQRDHPADQRALAKVYVAHDEQDALFEASVVHELQARAAIELDGLVRPVAVERVGDMLVLVCSPPPGVSLASLCAGGEVGTALFCTIALGLTRILVELHAQGLLHRDINPSSVCFDEGSGSVYLIDAGVAALLERERSELDDPALIQATLGCVAPEQLSRIRRDVDVRSDLYSLGAIFYQLLTGALPFVASSVAELVDAQLASPPRPLYGRVVGLPTVLAELVAKLLEKAPQRRYQTASGLLFDLQRFVTARASDEADPGFELGASDRGTGPLHAAKLYDREANARVLAIELGWARERRSRRLVVVHGEAGIGKSALLESFEAVVAGAGGSFAFGRYRPRGQAGLDGLSGLSGLSDALTGVAARLSSAPERERERWREQLVEQVGPLLPLVTALVPRFEPIVGQQPVLQLDTERARDAGQAGHALELALSRLFVGLERLGTLVLVLDDLQWADARSVELLRALLLDDAQTPLLIVVACSDVALQPDAPLAALLAELTAAGHEPGLVRLERLHRVALGQLLTELLGPPAEPADLTDLINLVMAQTGDIPGAVRPYVCELVERGLLSPSAGGWAWQPEAIARLPGERASCLRASPQARDQPERELLARAACLGPRFFAGELLDLCELSPATLAATLHELERRGVLARVGRELCFADPQLRVVALEQFDPQQRAGVHAKIAEQLLARHGPGARLDGRAFTLLHHLLRSTPPGLGADAGLRADQRAELAELSAAAGAHAVRLGARDTACAYLEFAVELAGVELGAAVDVGAWGLDLAVAHASVLAWCRRDADADAAFDQLLTRALPMSARGRVCVSAIRSLASRGRSEDALEIGLAGLAHCGVELTNVSPNVSPNVLGAVASPLSEAASLICARLATRAGDLEAPSRGPELDAAQLDAAQLDAAQLDAAQLDAAMLILAALERAWLVRDLDVFARLACVHLELVLAHGFHRTAPVALAYFGLVLAAKLGDADHGARLCDEALELCARVEGEPELRCLVEAIALLAVWPLSRPLRHTRVRAPELLRETVELGALELAGFIAGAGVWFGFVVAPELAVLAELVTRGRRWSARLDARGATDSCLGFDSWSRVIDRLDGQIAGTGSTELRGSGWVAEGELEQVGPATAAGVWIHQSVVQWLLGERAAARVSVSRFVDLYEPALPGSWALALGAVMVAILACERASASDDADEQGRALAQLSHARALAGRFVAQGWTNFHAFAEFVEAEHARACGRVDQALAGYERVCELAEDSDSACAQMLACERLMSLACAQRRRATARGATLTAIARGRRWGASAVVTRIERGHAELLADLVSLANVDQQPRSAPMPAQGDGDGRVDADLLVGMLFLIGEDLDLHEVISRVLLSALGTSDAERGGLLLESDGELREVARISQGSRPIHVDEPVSLVDAGEQLPVTVIDHVLRTGMTIVLDDASVDPRFANDPYVQLTHARSLLCMPISGPGGHIGALLLEHRLVVGVFSSERLPALRVLASQAGATLGHARTHEALRRSEVLFQTVVSGAPDMIALLDRQGRVEFINHLGGFPMDPAKLVGMDAAFLLGAGAAPRWRAAVASALETGERQELEVELELPDGSARWYEVRIGPVEFGGCLDKLLSVSTDITARKRAEAERLSLEAQLRQQQRLDSVGTLASGVAHEINNPIQGIMNYAELIVGRTGDTALVEEFAHEILIESDRVATIVRNLLAFSRQDVNEPTELRLVDELVATTMSLVRAVVTRDGIALNIDTPSGLARVRCRPQQIQQVIMNLVANARDAIRSTYPDPKLAPEGTNLISISARAVELGQGSVVRLSVADRGGGVPEHVQARIFDPFFTTKGRDQGAGLGLAVSHGIARDHGGELWFETEVGCGSVFHLDLPVDSN